MLGKERIKPLLNLIYSILGLVVFNGIIQFILYPFLNKKMGDASFGVVLTMLSMISMLSSSIGVSVNSSRMTYVYEKDSKNGDFNLILILFNILGIGILTIFLIVSNLIDFYTIIFLNLLMILTSFRYYADVEYRKSLNFFSFFIFYLIIGIGYCLGCLIYLLIPIWEISMILGELLALIFVGLKGNIFKSFFKKSPHFKKILLLSISLFIGEFLSAAILNADRVLLYFFIDSTAVTTFYVASLVGKIVAMVTVPLNGVIMGYLSRYTSKIDNKFVSIYMLMVFLLGAVALGCCLIASPIIIKLLYPGTYNLCEPIIFYAALSQVVFFCSNLALTLVIKFMNSRWQLIIN
ncbi:MAG: hypothetical protein ACI35S_08530, partial [Anaeroplasma sp.]